MTNFYQVLDNAYATVPAGSLNNTDNVVVINGIDTTRFSPVTTGYIVTVWDNENYSDDPSLDANMEKATVTAATIHVNGSLTITRNNPKTHTGTPIIAALVEKEVTTQLQTAVNAVESTISTLNTTKADISYVDTQVATKAPTIHTHDDRYYTETESNTLLASKASFTDVADAINGINYPVDSVNGRTGAVTGLAEASDVTTALSGKANSIHTHVISDTTGLQNALDNKQPIGDYATNSALTTGLATKANTVHAHAITDITNLQTTLDDKATTSYVDTKVASVVDTAPETLNTLNELAAALGDDANFSTTVTNQIAGKANAVHTHAIADTTGLQAALDGKQPTGDYATNTALTTGLAGKASTGHTHAIAEVTNLQTTLDGKAAASHTHTDLHTHSNKAVLDATTASFTIADETKLDGLATVATSGNYNDLSNKPDLTALNDTTTHASTATFPATGVTDHVYIAEDTGYMYRWNGTGYTQLTDQTAIWGQISGTLTDQTDLINELNAKATASDVVPYTGATGDVNLGTSALRAAQVYGTNEAGLYINAKSIETPDTAGAPLVAIASDGTGTGKGGGITLAAGNAEALSNSNGGDIMLQRGQGQGTGIDGKILAYGAKDGGALSTTNTAELNFNNVTGNKTFTFPNTSGTVALTSDITSGSGISQTDADARYLQLTGGTLNGNVTNTANNVVTLKGDLNIRNPNDAGEHYKIWSGNVNYDDRLAFCSTSSTDARYWFDSFSGGTGFSIAEAGNEKVFMGMDGGAFKFDCRGSFPIKFATDWGNERWRIENNTGHFLPNGNTTNIGNATNYVNNLYATRHYVNSTAYVDGATPGELNITGTTKTASDVEITDATKGVILRSPNGTRYRLTVENDGSLTTSAL